MVRADVCLNFVEIGLNFGSDLLAIQSKIKIIYSCDHLFIEFLKVTIRQGTMLDIGIINEHMKKWGFHLGE